MFALEKAIMHQGVCKVPLCQNQDQRRCDLKNQCIQNREVKNQVVPVGVFEMRIISSCSECPLVPARRRG